MGAGEVLTDGDLRRGRTPGARPGVARPPTPGAGGRRAVRMQFGRTHDWKNSGVRWQIRKRCLAPLGG